MCPHQRDFLDSFPPPGDSRCRWRSSLSVYFVSCRTHCPAELGNLTELPPEQRGPSGGMKRMIAPSVPPAPTGGGRGGAGWGCATTRAHRRGPGGRARPSAGAWRKGIPAAGADAKLAVAEYMFNYSRRRGLF